MNTKPAHANVKDSGVEWLGEIPTHWEVRKLGFLCNVKARLGWKGLKAEEYVPEGFIFLSTPNIKDKDIDFQNVNYITAERYYESPEIMLQEGDVLIAKDGSTLGIANVVRHLPASATVNSSIAVIRPNDTLYSVYLYYFLRSDMFQQTIQRMKGGMGVPHLFQADLRKFSIVFPPLPEQRAIAAFLDRKTQALDAIIRKKERLIDLLREKRQALISHAVTKGLDPTVPMKDSGVEWLGEIPAHWEIKRIKHLLSNNGDAIKTGPFGSQLVASEMTGDEIKVYNQRNVIDSDFQCGENYITIDKYKELKSFTVFVNDILLTSRGTIGRTAIVPQGAEIGILHPCLIRIQVNRNSVLPEYLSMVIQDSQIVRNQLQILSNATTIDVIYSYNLKNIVVPTPPVGEQEYILTTLFNSLCQIDKVIDKANAQIAIISEYRQTLISAAVTGKIDVREEVASCLGNQ